MKMLIKDMNVGQVLNGVAFAVKVSSVKQTKTKKDYLNLTLFDGQQDIGGNLWTWSGPAIPANTIVLVSGTVTEWAGNKQLNVSSVSVTSTYKIEDFAPSGSVDVDLEWKRAEQIIDMIQDEETKLFVSTIYNDFGDRIKVAPGAKTMHHAYVHGCLQHLVGVTTMALKIASAYEEANTDLIIAGAMLHDLGKLFEYKLDGVGISTTLDGELLYHIPIGTVIVDRYRHLISPGKLKLIQHIILSHHGKLEYASPVVPKCLEAMIVHWADNIDSRHMMVVEANKNATGQLTDKVWALGNIVLVTQQHVQETMRGKKEQV